MATESGHVLEEGKRLSESMLWRLDRDLYDALGVDAWGRGGVPQGITTTPHIARAYAKIALGFWRDVDAELDASQPVYILELGAGSGRFGYRFVKRMRWLLERSTLRHSSFTYVMSDASTRLIDYWQTHPMLRPLVDAGILDFAHVDALELGDVTLINAGVTLRHGTVANPLLVLANYFFDSIPHDCFSVIDGDLFENRVKVVSPWPEPGLNASQPFGDLAISFEPHPISPEHYPDAALNRVLHGYGHLTDSGLLFPISGMACIRHFQDLSDNRALFVVADVGSPREADVGAHTVGGFGREGNFWLHVNFHALGQYVGELGGTVLHPPHHHTSLNISAFILGQSTTTFAETGLAYEDAIAHGGPDDFFSLTQLIAPTFDALDINDLMAFLRSTDWDSRYFMQCLPSLLAKVMTASPRASQAIQRGIEQAWDVYYPIGGESEDLAFGCGALLFKLEEYPTALTYFHRSFELIGPDPETTFNIALCLYRLNRLPEAVEWLDRTLELDPTRQQAQDMRAAVTAELRPAG